MEKNENKKIKKIIFILLTLIVVAVLIFAGYFIFIKKGDIRNKIITADNYNEITDQITERLGDSDDAYYFTYACITYMAEEGLTEEYLNNQDDSILYRKIYDKTVNQLIAEGKTLMEENETTLEQFKQQVETINNLSNQVE